MIRIVIPSLLVFITVPLPTTVVVVPSSAAVYTDTTLVGFSRFFSVVVVPSVTTTVVSSAVIKVAMFIVTNALMTVGPMAMAASIARPTAAAAAFITRTAPMVDAAAAACRCRLPLQIHSIEG